MSTSLLFAEAATALVLAYVLYTTWTELSHARRARQLGCKPAYRRPYRLPFGIDLMQRYIKQAEQYTAQSDDLLLYEELGRRGTWYQNIMGSWHHITVEPENIQAILATQFDNFELGPIRRGMFQPLIGSGIFTSDGKDWAHCRSLLRPQFARGQVADVEMEETHVQHLLTRLPVGQDGWTGTIDLGPLFFSLTLDSATEFLFGQSALSQIEKPNERQGTSDRNLTKVDWANFGKNFDVANEAVSMRVRLLDFYFLYNPKSFRTACREVHHCVDHVVANALARQQDSKPTGESKKQKYIFLDELLHSTQDPVALQSHLLNVLLAGRDTTASALGWTFYYLARNPAVYRKLREAILETFGTDNSFISFESLKSCRYLQWVMKEVLRLEPAVPANSRRAKENTSLPRGGGPDGQSPIYVRAGQEMIYSTFIMQRRKDIWGEDANDFKPERWDSARVGWEYVPFHGGPRICLGQQFALTEVGYVIVRMLQRFDRIEDQDPVDYERRQYISSPAPVEVLVRLHEGSR